MCPDLYFPALHITCFNLARNPNILINNKAVYIYVSNSTLSKNSLKLSFFENTLQFNYYWADSGGLVSVGYKSGLLLEHEIK